MDVVCVCIYIYIILSECVCAWVSGLVGRPAGMQEGIVRCVCMRPYSRCCFKLSCSAPHPPPATFRGFGSAVQGFGLQGLQLVHGRFILIRRHSDPHTPHHKTS